MNARGGFVGLYITVSVFGGLFAFLVAMGFEVWSQIPPEEREEVATIVGCIAAWALGWALCVVIDWRRSCK